MPKEIVRVYLNDESFKTLALEPNSTSADVCAQLAKKMGMSGSLTKHFALCVFVNGSSMYFHFAHTCGLNVRRYQHILIPPSVIIVAILVLLMLLSPQNICCESN